MDGPNVAEAPNPADVKRGAMLGRGMLPCALMAIPGVVGHGLFLTEIDAAYIAGEGIVTRLERGRQAR